MQNQGIDRAMAGEVSRASKPEQIISIAQMHNEELIALRDRLDHILTTIAGQLPRAESNKKERVERTKAEGLFNLILGVQEEGRSELARVMEILALLERELGG